MLAMGVVFTARMRALYPPMQGGILNSGQRLKATKDSSVKMVRASMIGTVVEHYDFGIYGYMATVLAALFVV